MRLLKLKLFFLSFAFCVCQLLSAQVTIGTNNPPDPAAVLDLQSSSKGLLLPRLTTTQRNAISSPPIGLQIYNTDNHCVETYFPTGWKPLGCDCTVPPPAPVAINGPLHVCPGQGGIVFSVPQVQGALNYIWTIDAQDTLVTGQGNDSIVVHVSNASGNRTIQVIASNPCGNSLSYSITVNVSNPNPAYTVTPSPVLMNVASTFAATQGGGTYSWSFPSGSPATSVNQSQAVTWTNQGTYPVTLNITDADGCTASSTTNVVVTNCQPFTRNFTTCGVTGRTGPNQTQCNAAYGPGVVTVNNGIQAWTVPQNGNYSIEVGGASPPAQTYTTPYNYFGRGVKMKGTFYLTAGTVLQILVGQQPAQAAFNGGGGGTYVATGNSYTTATPLIIAGGGGSYRCGYNYVNYQAIIDASTSNNGKTSYVAGGTNGNGGACHSTGGASGAGFYGNGCGEGTPPLSFQNGGTGGLYTPNAVSEGGFGGGGQGNYGGAGGGGGYSGGGGPYNNPFPPAGGGGSYILPTAFNVATTDGLYNGSGTLNGAIQNLNSYNTGAGYVIITLTCQ